MQYRNVGYWDLAFVIMIHFVMIDALLLPTSFNNQNFVPLNQGIAK